ncbi:hypothetical protein DQ04_05371030 [Trypanosoma grayi]|uniref:hypothetical protein n=1 Tax=Trypanosoma grayi TaxID=71804 RepID=UPI0004F48E9D|nr:hypothetical protein DQ04_05371030 [Trypanosoma grayi]KEG09348.1 hypothetical protein DQ04_05371030 [Trypanosoma grayi]
MLFAVTVRRAALTKSHPSIGVCSLQPARCASSGSLPSPSWQQLYRFVSRRRRCTPEAAAAAAPPSAMWIEDICVCVCVCVCGGQVKWAVAAVGRAQRTAMRRT